MKKSFVRQGIVVSVLGFLLASTVLSEGSAEKRERRERRNTDINVDSNRNTDVNADQNTNVDKNMNLDANKASATVNLTEKAGTTLNRSEIGSHDRSDFEVGSRDTNVNERQDMFASNDKTKIESRSHDRLDIGSDDTAVSTNIRERKDMIGSQDVTGSEVGSHDTDIAVGGDNKDERNSQDTFSKTVDVAGGVRTNIDSGNTTDTTIGAEENVNETITYDSGNASADLEAPVPQPQSAPQPYVPSSSAASGPQNTGNAGFSANPGMPQSSEEVAPTGPSYFKDPFGNTVRNVLE